MKTSSPKGSLDIKDLTKALLVTIISSILTGVYQALQTGSILNASNLKTITLTALSSCIAYIIKNYLSNSDGRFLGSEKKIKTLNTTPCSWLKLINHIKDIFSKIPEDIRIAASYSLQITNIIRDLLIKSAADVITDITPTSWNDNLKTLMLAYIKEALPNLSIEQFNSDDTMTMLNRWISIVKQHPKHIQNALLQKFAALLSALQHGKKLPQALYDTYTQLMYTSNNY